MGETCTVTFMVNASGEVGESYEFFAYAYTSKDYYRESRRVNVTITSDAPTYQGPTAHVQVNNTTPYAGELVSFDASQSVSGEHSIVSYLWDFDASDGVDWVTPDGEGVMGLKSWDKPDTYTVTLLVADDATPSKTATSTAEIVVSQNPGVCGVRASCDTCLESPYPVGERCMWLPLIGKCYNLLDRCQLCNLYSLTGECSGECKLDEVGYPDIPALVIDDICPDAGSYSEVSWLSYAPVHRECMNGVCSPATLTKPPEQYNADLLARRQLSNADFTCQGSGCPLGYDALALIPETQSTQFLSDGYTHWVTQPNILYRGQSSDPTTQSTPVAEAGGPYVQDNNGVKLSGEGSYDAAGEAITEYLWDVDNDGILDFSGSEIQLSLSDMQSRNFIEYFPNTVKLTVTDEGGLQSSDTAIVYVGALTPTTTSTTVSTSSTSTLASTPCAGVQPPTEGDWLVYGETICENAVHEAGNLEISDWQVLELSNFGAGLRGRIELGNHSRMELTKSNITLNNEVNT